MTQATANQTNNQTKTNGGVSNMKKVIATTINVNGVQAPLKVKLALYNGTQLVQTVEYGYSKLGGRTRYLAIEGQEPKRVEVKGVLETLKTFGVTDVEQVHNVIKSLKPLFTRQFITCKCSKCQAPVTAAEMDYIQRNYQKLGVGEFTPICLNCQPNTKKSASEASASPVKPVHVPAKAQPKAECVCVGCGVGITSTKVQAYSKANFGGIYCIPCQGPLKAAKKAPVVKENPAPTPKVEVTEIKTSSTVVLEDDQYGLALDAAELLELHALLEDVDMFSALGQLYRDQVRPHYLELVEAQHYAWKESHDQMIFNASIIEETEILEDEHYVANDEILEEEEHDAYHNARCPVCGDYVTGSEYVDKASCLSCDWVEFKYSDDCGLFVEMMHGYEVAKVELIEGGARVRVQLHNGKSASTGLVDCNCAGCEEGYYSLAEGLYQCDTCKWVVDEQAFVMMGALSLLQRYSQSQDEALQYSDDYEDECIKKPVDSGLGKNTDMYSDKGSASEASAPVIGQCQACDSEHVELFKHDELEHLVCNDCVKALDEDKELYSVKSQQDVQYHSDDLVIEVRETQEGISPIDMSSFGALVASMPQS